MPRPLDEATAIEAVYRAADALRAACEAIHLIPFGFNHKPTGLDELLDEKLYPGDLGDLAAALAGKADEWKDSLDERQAEANEADDRRRANPLESDFRAYS
jgi:hypothetical protein